MGRDELGQGTGQVSQRDLDVLVSTRVSECVWVEWDRTGWDGMDCDRIK